MVAYKLYPIRMRVINALTKVEEWITLADVPQLSTEKGSAGAERSRLRRMAILQRVLYLALRSTIHARHNGVSVSGGVRGQLLAFPRVILYICDQPEERQALCFRPGMCQRPCTMCEVSVSDLGLEAALLARKRCAVSVVERQLEAHGHLTHGREKRRRLQIEKEWSVNSQPPALAAMAGLCTPPFLLCNIVAIDVLHVRSLHRCLRCLSCCAYGVAGVSFKVLTLRAPDSCFRAVLLGAMRLPELAGVGLGHYPRPGEATGPYLPVYVRRLRAALWVLLGYVRGSVQAPS